jgi:hypothetical protein
MHVRIVTRHAKEVEVELVVRDAGALEQGGESKVVGNQHGTHVRTGVGGQQGQEGAIHAEHVRGDLGEEEGA